MSHYRRECTFCCVFNKWFLPQTSNGQWQASLNHMQMCIFKLWHFQHVEYYLFLLQLNADFLNMLLLSTFKMTFTLSLAALAALYLTLVFVVAKCHFRNSTQIVTFETREPSNIWLGWWTEKKVEKKVEVFFPTFFSHLVTLTKCLKGLKSQKSLFVSKF